MGNLDTSILSSVIEVVQEMVDDLGVDIDDALGESTLLIGDLGFASVDFIHLLVALEGKFARKMGFHDLIMPNGQYVSDLSVGDFARFIQSRLHGQETKVPVVIAPAPEDVTATAVVANHGPKVSQEDYEKFLSLMPSVEKWGTIPVPAKKNGKMAFVLSSPRSGSTLLRVILAGNPALLSPPEFHLLYFGTMAQRREALANKLNEHLLSGTTRAVMHLKDCGVEEAESFIRSCEEQGMSTHDFYAVLLEMAGDRLLVDKTPTYALHSATLHRAERDFDEPLFVHIVRHPCGMIRSFADAQMQQFVPFMRESSFTNFQLAELAWYVSNKNVADFFKTLPANRCLRVRYEDLVKTPETEVRRICEFLGTPYSEHMLDPYKEPSSRMTDGLTTSAQLGGDLKFFLHNRIEPEAADRWKKFDTADSLGGITRDLAAEFGYFPS